MRRFGARRCLFELSVYTRGHGGLRFRSCSQCPLPARYRVLHYLGQSSALRETQFNPTFIPAFNITHRTSTKATSNTIRTFVKDTHVLLITTESETPIIIGDRKRCCVSDCLFRSPGNVGRLLDAIQVCTLA